MLSYEYYVRDEFRRVRELAANLRTKFSSGGSPEELLGDVNHLGEVCTNLQELLPKEIRDRTNLRRHLGWMQRNVRDGHTYASRGDIEDICILDVPTMEKLFLEWCQRITYRDSELAEKIGPLAKRGEYDSAIRKGFVILKTRMVSKFGLSDKVDGAKLVNSVFADSGPLAATVSGSDRQAMRDLLAGLYGLFRNKLMHHDVETPWHEAEAIIAMINLALKRIDDC